jgi:hypothetical protein
MPHRQNIDKKPIARLWKEVEFVTPNTHNIHDCSLCLLGTCTSIKYETDFRRHIYKSNNYLFIICILLTCRKHVHDRIVSLTGKLEANKTSLT